MYVYERKIHELVPFHVGTQMYIGTNKDARYHPMASPRFLDASQIPGCPISVAYVD